MACKSIDVLVVGACNIDLVSYTEVIPKPGETVQGEEFRMVNGGKGGNQSAIVGLLGGKVAMVGRVGDDYFGSMYREQLKCYGVDISTLLVTPNATTGVAAILVNKSTGENQIVLSAGANHLLTVNDFSDDIISLINQSKVVVVQLEIKKEVTLHALKLAKRYGAVTIFNTAPAYSDLDPEFFKNTDVICFNETEGEILSNMKLDHTNIDSQKSIICKILDYGCKAAVFTKGKMGALLMYSSNRDKLYTLSCQYPPTKVVDTTGAGDCLVGSMAYLISKKIINSNLSIEDILTPNIVQTSVNIASLCVQKIGAQTSYPSIYEIPKEYIKL